MKNSNEPAGDIDAVNRKFIIEKLSDTADELCSIIRLLEHEPDCLQSYVRLGRIQRQLKSVRFSILSENIRKEAALLFSLNPSDRRPVDFQRLQILLQEWKF